MIAARHHFNGVLAATVSAKMRLNFAEERFQFDPMQDVEIGDDGTPVSSTLRLEYMQFCKDLLLNGKLEVYESGTDKRLGRKDAYLAVNINPGPTLQGIDAQISLYQGEAVRRAKQGGMPA